MLQLAIHTHTHSSARGGRVWVWIERGIGLHRPALTTPHGSCKGWSVHSATDLNHEQDQPGSAHGLRPLYKRKRAGRVTGTPDLSICEFCAISGFCFYPVFKFAHSVSIDLWIGTFSKKVRRSFWSRMRPARSCRIWYATSSTRTARPSLIARSAW